LECAREYEQALDAYQAGRFAEAHELAAHLAQVHPADAAAVKLRDRAGRQLEEYLQCRMLEADLATWTGALEMDL